MKVVIQKSTGKMLESCTTSHSETLLSQALADYPDIPEIDMEVREVTETERDAMTIKVPPPPLELLLATDKGMARVAEDIYDMLVAEGKTFPQSVVDKIAERKALRAQLMTH